MRTAPRPRRRPYSTFTCDSHSAGTTLGNELHELMGALYRVDPAVQKGMLGMKPPELDEQTAFRSGLGGVRWFEGWPVRRRDSRGDGTVRVPLHLLGRRD